MLFAARELGEHLLEISFTTRLVELEAIKAINYCIESIYNILVTVV